jgi:hypothetical protein
MKLVTLSLAAATAFLLSAGVAAADMQPIPNPPETHHPMHHGRHHGMGHHHHGMGHHHHGHHHHDEAPKEKKDK